MRLNNPAADYLKPTKDNKTPNVLWDKVWERYNLGMELRRSEEREWILNLAFLSGRQYVYFNNSAHVLQQVLQQKGTIRSIENKLLPRWRRQIADSIKNKPSMSVVPKTLEDEDIKAARIGNKVLEHFWREAKMPEKIRLLSGWKFACGTAFLDDRWNEKLGPIEVDPETGLPIYLGDVECNVWSPFEILVPYVSVGAQSHHRFPWLIKLKQRSLEELINRHGSEAKKVPAEQQSVPTVDLNGLLGVGTSAGALKVPSAMEINYYEQPNPINKKGLFILAANGIILNKQDYPFNDYNLEVFKDIEVPGMFWGKATLTDGVPLQITWNETLSSIKGYNRVMAKGKLMVPRGANLEQLPDDQHGEAMEYTPVYGHKPEHIDLKGLPTTYPLILEYTERAFQDLFSQHEVSQGTNKSDIRSGEMVSLLREQDAHGNIPSSMQGEESLEAVMTRVLKRIQAGYKGERMLKIVGREREFEIFAFQGADLRGNTDVAVKQQSSLPESRSARNVQVLDRFERGVYGNPQDPEVRRQVQNMLDDAIVDNIYDEIHRDETYARYENRLMMEGQGGPELINSYDNHAVHIKEHNYEQKSMEFQRLRIDDPKKFEFLSQVFLSHKMIHQEFLQEEQAQMIAMQAQMQQGGSNAQSQGQSARTTTN